MKQRVIRNRGNQNFPLTRKACTLVGMPAARATASRQAMRWLQDPRRLLSVVEAGCHSLTLYTGRSIDARWLWIRRSSDALECSLFVGLMSARISSLPQSRMAVGRKFASFGDSCCGGPICIFKCRQWNLSKLLPNLYNAGEHRLVIPLRDGCHWRHYRSLLWLLEVCCRHGRSCGQWRSRFTRV